MSVETVEATGAARDLIPDGEVYREFFEKTKHFIFCVDRDKRITYVNAFAASQLRRWPEDIVGKSLTELFPPEHAERMMGNVERVFAKNEFDFIEGPTSFGEEVRWLETWLVPIEKGGKPDLIFGVSRDITVSKALRDKLRASEQAARESAERFRGTLDNMLEGCMIIDRGWRLAYVNDAAAAQGRRKKEDMIGRTLVEVFPDAERMEIFSRAKECMERGRPSRMDMEYVFPDDERRWYQVSLQSVPEGIFVLSLDITAGKISERDAKEEEQRFKILSAAAFEAIALLEHGKIMLTNQAMSEMFGYAADELAGRAALDLVAPESRDAVRTRIATESEELYEANCLRKDGSKFTVEIRGRKIDFQGRRMRLSVIRDITEHKRSVEALVESERKYRDFIDGAVDPVVILDNQGKVLQINQAAVRVIGRPKGEIEGKNLIALKIFTPKSKWLILKNFALRRLGKVIPPYEAEFLGAAGQIIPVEISAALIRRDDQAIGDMAIIRDLTERKRSEAQLKEVNELRYKFIQIVSHQLRTPLNSVRWSLENLLSGEVGEVPPAVKELLRVDYRATLEIIKRISDLTTVLDIEEGRVLLDWQESALDELFAPVFAEVEKRAQVKGVSCVYIRPEQKLLPLNVDSEKIRDVFHKLLMNAITYTPAGGRVDVKLFQTDAGKIRFEVRDNGIGIPSAEQSRIFSKFYRASNAVTVLSDASGVSLAIAKYYVEQHGGTIGFASQEGRGSTFWFELPIV